LSSLFLPYPPPSPSPLLPPRLSFPLAPPSPSPLLLPHPSLHLVPPSVFSLSPYLLPSCLSLPIFLLPPPSSTYNSRISDNWEVSQSHGSKEVKYLWEGSLVGYCVGRRVHVERKILERRMTGKES